MGWWGYGFHKKPYFWGWGSRFWESNGISINFKPRSSFWDGFGEKKSKIYEARNWINMCRKSRKSDSWFSGCCLDEISIRRYQNEGNSLNFLLGCPKRAKSSKQTFTNSGFLKNSRIFVPYQPSLRWSLLLGMSLGLRSSSHLFCLELCVRYAAWPRLLRSGTAIIRDARDQYKIAIL